LQALAGPCGTHPIPHVVVRLMHDLPGVLVVAALRRHCEAR
jgi:hypothetical protein